jgi:hypothetical protein
MKLQSPVTSSFFGLGETKADISLKSIQVSVPTLDEGATE